MQIAVNTRLLIKDKLDGIGWFSYQTLKRITQNNPDVHFVFLFDRNFDEEFLFNDNITPVIIGPQARHPFLYYAWFQFSVKNTLNRLKPDLFLSPDGFLSLGATCKQLSVIHDINFLHYPKDSKWLTSRYYNNFFPKFAKQATRIATVSEFSKNDIAANYKIESSKIDVVYNGINPFFKPLTENEQTATKQKYSQGKDYFVFVGSLHPRKNVAMLVKAFALFKQCKGVDLKLLIVGPEFWATNEIKDVITSHNLSNEVVLTGRLENNELANVMGSAMALTFVPYYEGFGIPLVEAMESQVPIIAANTSSLPEVAADAALYVDPFNAEEIKDAMLKIHSDEKIRNELIQKGKTQKQKFSWDKSSDLLWQSVLKACEI